MKFLILILLSSFLCQCSHPLLSTKPQTRQRLIMGTLLSVQLLPKDKEAFETVFANFQDLDNKLSTYKYNSEVNRLNSGQSISLSPNTLSVFNKSLELNKTSNGYFNIFIGKKTLAARKNPKSLILKKIKPLLTGNYDLSENSLKLKNGAKIDFGAVAKGFAVDASLSQLKARGIKQAQISASGDIGCLGPCQIFIQHPNIEAAFVSLKNTNPRLAVSTSGNYRKSISHIANPKTGRFVKHWKSVSLISNDNNTELDAFTTAVFSMPRPIAMDFLKQKNLQYILIDHKRNVYTSAGLETYVSEVKWLNTKDLNIK